MKSEKNRRQFLNLCALIRELRQRHNLSQREMAALLGVGVHTLRQLEAGRVPPRVSVRIVYRIYDAFGIPPAAQFDPERLV